MNAMSILLFVGASVLADTSNPVNRQDVPDGRVMVRKPLYDLRPPRSVTLPEVARGDWVIVRKPRYDLLPAARVEFTDARPLHGYSRRAVGLPGETVPTHVGKLAGVPVIAVERITIEGGKVEITEGSIVIEGGRVEIVRRADR